MFVVEYDLVITKMQSFKDEQERRVRIYDKFEDALADYRRVSEMETPFQSPAALNLKISKAVLEEIDVTQFL